MKVVRYYGGNHPMLVKVTHDASGDPARGPWKPKSLRGKKK